MFRFYKRRYGIRNKKVVILLSGWQSTQAQYWFVSKLLERNGFYCLTYTYDKEFLDLNPELTVKNVSLVVVDILEEISLFKGQGVADIAIFGTSLGSVPAIIAANKTENVNKLILNTSGFDMAKTIWGWDHVLRGFKEKMVISGITLEKLTQKWKNINPKNNLVGLRDKKILLLSSRNDKIIPFEQADKLRRAILEINESILFKSSGRFGHLSYGIINLLRAPGYLASL